MYKDTPVHPALQHQIVNSPNPGSHPVMVDGWAGMPIILGDPMSFSVRPEEWWLSASSPAIRSKLIQRIMREGFVLPIVTAVCVALLAEMYSTTSGSSTNKKQRRIRLRYKSSPIADFGIAVGSARVTDQDKLVYFRLSDGTIVHGQDPKQHYWIYFTTVRGEEITLDCAMYTFNMCIVVGDIGHYAPELAPITNVVPSYFRDREIRLATPELYRERKRMSLLRNEGLHTAVSRSATGFSRADVQVFREFMEDLSGKSCSQKEEELFVALALNSCNVIQVALENRRWTVFPMTPKCMLQPDPVELEETAGQLGDGMEDWFKYLRKWKKLKKHGKVENETIGDAFEKWRSRWFERGRARQ